MKPFLVRIPFNKKITFSSLRECYYSPLALLVIFDPIPMESGLKSQK